MYYNHTHYDLLVSNGSNLIVKHGKKPNMVEYNVDFYH